MDKGTIRGKFDKMAASYPTYDKLPKPLFDTMVSLNGGETDYHNWTNTSCCVQLSHALNLGGIIVPPSSYRRPNTQIEHFYYLLVPDEVEAYLSGRYGRGEDIHKVGDINAMKAYIAGEQGILVFRSAGLGAHVELWDEDHILQDGSKSADAVMNQNWCFGQPRVIFYEIIDPDDDDDTPPAWLQGWWEVYDTNYYYYYFNDEYVVTYTEKKPANPRLPPVRLPGNDGELSVSDDELTVEIDWSPTGGDQTIETFTRSANSTTFMNGTSNRFGPLTAKKL